MVFPNSLDCAVGLLTASLVCGQDCAVHVYRLHYLQAAALGDSRYDR